MNFSIMFFSSAESENTNRYGLLTQAAKLADEGGLVAVWTPERHFHRFGGLYPNPAVLSAALAMVTESIELRAGSLISPIHDVIRIAESWSVVDNLSSGRVALSFGSGWNIDDFIFFPDRYEQRHKLMYEQIEEVRKLWLGGAVKRRNSAGRDVEVCIYPKPIRQNLPVWVTSSGNVETFRSAGRIGANLLTHLIGQDLAQLAGKIECYREARREHGFDPDIGVVTLMLHTFIGEDALEVREQVYRPFREYLRSAVSLEQMAALDGGVISGGHDVRHEEIPAGMMEELLDLTFERYYASGSLLGTPAKCKEMVLEVGEAGVDEIACLIDFLDDRKAVVESLRRLCDLSTDLKSAAVNLDVSDFMANLEG